MTELLPFIIMEIVKQVPSLGLKLIGLWQQDNAPTPEQISEVFKIAQKSYEEYIKEAGGRPQ